ncbi:Outer membrane receptor for ferrienterochelin and colicins [Colwellia chukchiensis]|uniref:Outer membrane receptor for ferrienterochelin and colicins n=1 Tax=Colwellia chukchiensis TaxID=641665 RepID=A0A1H7ST10_9GAMM|nr:TonB-dependent receptor [Colwellia chukchiensis]SEL75064.1 Outer membrane receptor for ferrienterochelin and colicins [Colwellia chukchiensis]
MKTHRLSRITGAVVLALGLSTSVYANTTSSSIKGEIVGPQGNAAVGTTVTLTHVPSGTTRKVVVNNSGLFGAQGLRVGGPYTITIDSNRFKDRVINDVYLKLGEPLDLRFALDNDTTETITVTGSRLTAAEFGSTSPATNFNLEDLETAASADRDIKDLVRVDPRINIEESDGEEAIICAGSNPRYSSLTVDGVRMNDSFGLNFNGYPTVRMPFSFSSLDQINVEIAPFGVQAGGFTGCNINAVTKSGTNELHGSLFYDYSSDSLRGDKIEGEDIDTGDYTEKRFGFDVGFPLIKDTLFFFGAYEKLEGAQLFQYDALGNQISQAELDRAIQIARDVYNYDAGGTPASMPVEDEKVLIKLDWNINDEHRASLVYNYNDGFRLDQSDERNNTVTLDNHFYEVGAKLNSIVGSLYSDWTDDFSTELRIGRIKLANRQQSLDADSGFGEVQIERINGASIYLGPDDSRQSNELNWESETLKLAGTYYLDNHTITGGYEYENLNVFNLFMQHTVGEYRFNGLDDFEAGLADDIYYNNSAGTNNPEDAAASFEYATHAAYIQDEYVFDDVDLTIVFGLRYDWYTSDDTPRFNETFYNRYNMRNDHSLDGKNLLQPRFGFNWRVEDNLEVRGGFGLYSGGNPNVWLSNSYSNDGITNIDTYRSDFQLLNPDGTPIDGLFSGSGNPIYDPLQEQVDEVAANDPSLGNEPSVNAIDPNFEIPSEWKYNLGFTYTTDSEYIIQGDLLFSQKKDSAIIEALHWDNANRTEASDGRAIYDYIVVGQRSDGRDIKRNFRKSDFLLTNAKENGKSTTISIAVKKEFDYGLDASFGYAYNKSEDVSPMTSAVSFSNFTGFATTDAQNPGLATSNYETPHRFTFNLRYTTEIVDGYKTNFTLFGSRTKGRPMSYAFDGMSVGATEFRSRRHLLYVPTLDDPNVTYADDFNHDEFNEFVESKGFKRGEIVARNSHNADWHTRLDFRIDQQLPGFYKDHKANAYIVIKNLANMLNDDWGVKKTGNFVAQNVVDARLNNDGTYTFNEFIPENAEQTTFLTQSLWEVRIGVKYKF